MSLECLVVEQTHHSSGYVSSEVVAYLGNDTTWKLCRAGIPISDDGVGQDTLLAVARNIEEQDLVLDGESMRPWVAKLRSWAEKGYFIVQT